MALVKIEYVGSGQYQCDKPVIYVDAGELIEWECRGKGHFCIHLGWDWPKQSMTHARRQDSILDLDTTGVPKGRYKYTIVVFDPTNGEFFVDDPEFIVRG